MPIIYPDLRLDYKVATHPICLRSYSLGLCHTLSTNVYSWRLSEIQLASNTYRVMFFGNGYTNAELAVEYALRRCAELKQQNGYRYFGILAVNDFSEQRSWNIPGSAYTTGSLSVSSFGNTAFGNYNQTTFITPAQTIRFNFPHPVITIQMVNNQIPGATLFEVSVVLSNQLPGVPNTNIALASSIPARRTGPPID